MNLTHSISHSTALTRLIQCFFAVILLFAGLTTTGCGLIDSNGPEDVEVVASQEVDDDAGFEDIEDGDDSPATIDDEEGYPDGAPALPVTKEVCTIIKFHPAVELPDEIEFCS